MIAKEVVPGVFRIPLGAVNAFLLDADGLTLIDTGTPGSAGQIVSAIRELGKNPSDLRQIVVTHCHADHSGSLAALQREIDVPAFMHPIDAAMVREGKAKRPLIPAPGLMTKILYQAFVRNAPTTMEPAQIQREVSDGEELPIAGGLRAIHVPGHCAGQIALLWPRQGGVLFAADVAGNPMGRLGWSLGYEDLEEGRRSLARLGGYRFEVACFGHGSDLKGGASARFRERWEDASSRSGDETTRAV